MDRSSRISGSSDMDRPEIAGQTVELMPAAGGQGEARRVGHPARRGGRPNRAHRGEPRALGRAGQRHLRRRTATPSKTSRCGSTTWSAGLIATLAERAAEGESGAPMIGRSARHGVRPDSDRDADRVGARFVHAQECRSRYVMIAGRGCTTISAVLVGDRGVRVVRSCRAVVGVLLLLSPAGPGGGPWFRLPGKRAVVRCQPGGRP